MDGEGDRLRRGGFRITDTAGFGYGYDGNLDLLMGCFIFRYDYVSKVREGVEWYKDWVLGAGWVGSGS